MNSRNSKTPCHTRALTLLRVCEISKGASFWCIMIGASFLIGFSFIQGAALFTEASRSAADAPGLLAGINPFDGVFVPTFGAFYLVQTLLLPFVVVGIFANEKESGAERLNHLAPWSLCEDLTSRFFTFLATWLGVFLLPLSTLLVWNLNSGHLYFCEMFNLILGHALYGFIIFGISFFATSVSASSATSAIIVLAFTLGSWILDFMAPAQTGWLLELSTLSLTAQIRSFESGLLDVGILLKMLALFATFLGIGVIANAPTKRVKSKFLESIFIGFVCILFFVFIPGQKFSYDLTEDRRHSFDSASETALKSLKDPLVLHIALSPDDSRFKDFNRSVLRPLVRAVPLLTYEFDAKGVAMNALAPNGTDSYGIVTYTYRSKSDQSRSTSPEEVLSIIFKLANIQVSEASEVPYRGYPLELSPIAPKLIYYVFFPLLFLMLFGFFQRKKLLEVIGYEK